MDVVSKEEVRAKVLEAVPVSCKGIVQRAFAGTASPRDAIKASCLQCSGYDRAEITNCRVIACALFEYRPYQAKADEPEGSQE